NLPNVDRRRAGPHLTRRSALRAGPAPSAHRPAARPKGLDRGPGPAPTAPLPRRAPPPSVPSGNYARRDAACFRLGEVRVLSVLTLSAAGRAATAPAESLDRAPDPSLAHAPAARASSSLGDFARRDPDCYRVGEAGGGSF